MSQANFQKRMREKARQEKAAAKRERKEQRVAEAEAEAAAPDEPAVPQDEVLAKLAALHERFEADEVELDEFEERKQELIAQLAV